MSEYISASMTAEQQAAILGKLDELLSDLSFGIKLTPEQKKVMTKVDDTRLPFVEKGIQFGKQESRIVPPFVDLEEYTSDLNLFNMLGPVEAKVLQLAEIISDTRTAAGTDAYQAALSIYRSVKGAAKNGVPGTKTIVEELGKLFSGQGTARKANTSE